MEDLKIPMEFTKTEWETIEKALEKSNPMKPIVRQTKGYWRKRYYCSVCSRQLSANRTTDHYCAKCGQRIDWNGV